MCKIMLVAGLKPENKTNNWNFIHTMGSLMTPNNVDGLGYTAVDTKGDIFGERWLFNAEAFEQRKNRFTTPKKVDKSKTSLLKEKLSDFMEMEEEVEMGPIEKYGTFGNLTSKITAITLHTRAASGTVTYKNIHPFVDVEKSISVVHNGFINNHTVADEIRSTCDSERILNRYIEHEINKNPADMQNFIDDLKGWFACGIFSKDRDNRRVMDVFKTTASLSAAYVKELDAVVFSTSLGDIKTACRHLGFSIQSQAKSVKDDVLLRLDANTGEKILTLKYRDTTRTTNYRHWERNNDEYWEKLAKEREENAKKKEAETKTLALVPDIIEEERPTETQTQEAAELARSGVLTQEEIEAQERERSVKAIMERGHTREVAEAYLDKKYAIAKLVKQGWLEDDARDLVEKNLHTNLVTNEVKKSKDIINKVTDKLMENLAAADDYYMIEDTGIWMKRVNQKH